MRTIEKGHAFIREAVEVINAVQLTEAGGDLDATANYSNNDYLHSGVLVFSDAFQNASESYVRITQVKIWIYDTGLFKPSMRLLLFNKPGTLLTTNPPTKNDGFGLVSGFTRDNLRGYNGSILDLSSLNFMDVKIGATTYDAKGIWNITTDNYIKNNNEANLYGVLLYNGSGSEKFNANATLDISIGLIHC